MASLADVFTEKERTNWLKAWLAVGIAKSGLEQFAENEANTVHANIYKSVWSSVRAPVACIGCDTSNLLKCPTPGICNKRGANSTCKTAHALKQPRPCPVSVCNKVFDEIIKEHKFSKPSWKNTSAKQWASNPWQIAKAYLPPDGYSEKNSVQDTDFNGIISFMVNCKHFDSKFSFDIAPDKTSPPSLLTEARDIGRSIRHSTTCKVTDADLQKIFITLTSLLSDQQCLAHHATAQEAVRKLAKLQSDVLRITTEEMMKLLEAAQDKINTLGHIANAAIDEMRIYVENCRKELNTHMGNCIQKVDEHTEAGVLELTALMTRVRDVIHSDIAAGRETISAQVEVAKREIRDFKATNDEDYYLRRKELLAMMLDHYNRTLSNVKTSPLNDWVQAKVDDIYMPPNLQLMVKDNWSFKKADTPITQYSNVFFTDGKYN